MTTEMEDKMRTAGVDVAKSRLAEAAWAALQRCNKNEVVATRSLMATVRSDGELLETLVAQYVHERVQDMRGSVRETASQLRFENQNVHDCRSPALSESSRPSQEPADRLRRSDRPAAPLSSSGEARQEQIELHEENDRPPARGVSASAKRAARAVARSCAFDIKIGIDVTLGDLTRTDVINLRRKGIVVDHITERLLTEVEWKGDDVALKHCCSESKARDIYNSAYEKLSTIPVEGVSRVSH